MSSPGRVYELFNESVPSSSLGTGTVLDGSLLSESTSAECRIPHEVDV